jgi:hypothetical protein
MQHNSQIIVLDWCSYGNTIESYREKYFVTSPRKYVQRLLYYNHHYHIQLFWTAPLITGPTLAQGYVRLVAHYLEVSNRRDPFYCWIYNV